MFAVRRMHLDAEIVKGILLGILAALLAWVIGLRTAAGESNEFAAPEIMPLPSVMAPLVDPNQTPAFFPEDGPKPLFIDRALAARLQEIVRLHATGKEQDAVVMWRSATLPPDGDTWRRIALGAVALQNDDLDTAAAELEAVRFLAPRHPVVAYFTGILRLRQAQRASEFDPGVIAPATYPPQIQPAVRGMFEVAAMHEFKEVLAWKDEVNAADPLVAITGKEGPTVGDLLAALDAEPYVGRAHHTLGWLYLDRGMAKAAEEQFDEAVHAGVRVPVGYRRLGEILEREDEPQGAFRVYLKHLGQYGDGCIQPACDAFRNLKQLFRG